jgi:nucleoside-diphosphate-sugar epimerase
MQVLDGRRCGAYLKTNAKVPNRVPADPCWQDRMGPTQIPVGERTPVMNLGQEIQTVLVTGGTGFVGGAVAQRLRSENCTVRALVRRNSDTAAPIRYELEIGGRDMHYSNSKIVRELGFSPRVLPEKGLTRTIEWLKSMDLSKIKTK